MVRSGEVLTVTSSVSKVALMWTLGSLATGLGSEVSWH